MYSCMHGGWLLRFFCQRGISSSMAVRRLLAALLAAEQLGSSSSSSASSVGDPWLFFDLADTVNSSGVTIRTHKPTVHDDEPPVLEPSEPWEGGRISYYTSVLDINGTVHLYYDAHGPLPAWAGRATCLAVSTDGRTFSRPNLGLSTFNGSTSNNIVWPTDDRGDASVPGCNDKPGPGCRQWWSPGASFEDSAAPAGERFKLVGGWCPSTSAHPCLGTWIFSSPDGIHFTNASTVPIYHGSDTQDVVVYDERLQKYVAYRRLHKRGAGDHKYDRGADGRSCERCRPTTPGYPALNMSGQSCGYACSDGPRGEACGGCSHLAPVPCSADADCAEIRRWSALTLCQSAAASGNVCGERNGSKICLNPSAEPLCVGPEECGLGYAAERFVGRCESATLGFEGANCDEGGATPVEVAAGPDEIDSPCVDFYQSNAILYQGHYLAFPAAYEHTALPPAWGQFDITTDAWAEGDGFVDSRLMHSRNGLKFSYIAGDRTPFFGRGPSFAPPAPSHVDTPNASDPRSWRESMAVIARGHVVRGDKIFMYGLGTRARHNQDDSTDAQGGGGQITRLSLRLDGFASVSAALPDAAGEFTTKRFVLSENHTQLLLNAQIDDGGEIAVGISLCDGATCAAAPGFGVEQCIVQAGDVIYSQATEWAGRGSDLSQFRGRQVQLTVRMRQPADLFGFKLGPLKTDDDTTKMDEGRIAATQNCMNTTKRSLGFAIMRHNINGMHAPTASAEECAERCCASTTCAAWIYRTAECGPLQPHTASALAGTVSRGYWQMRAATVRT
eukprot:COSAG06_NODE_1446_length_9441_cov_7.431813_3_plen_786_part_00